jgi:hypothetical protein
VNQKKSLIDVFSSFLKQNESSDDEKKSIVEKNPNIQLNSTLFEKLQLDPNFI